MEGEPQPPLGTPAPATPTGKGKGKGRASRRSSRAEADAKATRGMAGRMRIGEAVSADRRGREGGREGAIQGRRDREKQTEEGTKNAKRRTGLRRTHSRVLTWPDALKPLLYHTRGNQCTVGSHNNSNFFLGLCCS